ncbi:MAG: Wzz/FepE/Etk N-terminal domain-containing protein, partial [Planctomycetota bacterium]|nr:Wzz/FepE/Etk N-terminal domain-containing protein [Planctomycetota bacterium]
MFHLFWLGQGLFLKDFDPKRFKVFSAFLLQAALRSSMRSEPHSPTDTAIPTPPLVDLKELWRGKWFIGKVTLLMVALGVGYLLVTPKTYEVNSRVMVRRDNPSLE